VRQRWLRGCILAVALTLASQSLAQQIGANLEPGKTPVLITADQLTYDRDLGVIVASGHVEVSQDNRVLRSDTLTYNERQKTVSASGNVALVDESGNIAFADYMQVTDDLKNAIIQNIRLLMTDKSRMAAATGRRTGPVDELDRAVYSPCLPCVSDPMRPPAWQLTAARAVHDNIAHTIVYHNAWMEIFGLPVFYTPYFSTPDPTVKRKSGFLVPRFATSDQLGFQLQIPYYWVINPESDLILDPIFLTKGYPVFSGHYRQRVENGKFEINGSVTSGDIVTTDSNGITTTANDQLRGHVFAKGQFDLNDNWRAGFDLNRESDIDYIRLYGFPNNFARSLDSTVYLEGFDGRNYASVQAYSFQGLRTTDVQDQTPFVAPLINYNLVSEPGPGGAYWTFDAGLMSLNRIDGTDSQRINAKLGWVLPYTAPAGDIYKLGVSVRADGYFVTDVLPGSNNPSPTGPTESGFAGRIFPQLTFDWRYPFVRRSPGISQVFEPIFSASIATNGGNDSLIPNEDSLDFQFDETNLFSADRFTGLDLVDNGQRINYGFKYSIYGDGGGHSSLLLGQSYQFNSDNAFAAGSGQSSQLSSIVGALDISPSSALDLLYRFQIQAAPFSFLRQEFGMHVNVGPVDAGIDYAFLNDSINDGSTLGTQQEFNAFARFKINDNWSIQIDGRRDLESGTTLQYGGGVTWQNDCMALSLLGSRSNYSTDQIEPDTRFLFLITLKNLGTSNLSL
jgi:LPS-assembly protein